MKIIQKQHSDDTGSYYFHSIDKWFLLIKKESGHSGFDVQLRYGFTEENVLDGKHLEKTAEQEIKAPSCVGKIKYANIETDLTGEVVLLSIADVTIVAKEYPLSVTMTDTTFEQLYSKYLEEGEENDYPVDVDLPEDEFTKITMGIDDFWQSIDGEYAFGTRMDMEYFENLSLVRKSIIEGDIDDLLEQLHEYESDTDVADTAKKLISQLESTKSSVRLQISKAKLAAEKQPEKQSPEIKRGETSR